MHEGRHGEIWYIEQVPVADSERKVIHMHSRLAGAMEIGVCVPASPTSIESS